MRIHWKKKLGLVTGTSEGLILRLIPRLDKHTGISMAIKRQSSIKVWHAPRGVLSLILPVELQAEPLYRAILG